MQDILGIELENFKTRHVFTSSSGDMLAVDVGLREGPPFSHQPQKSNFVRPAQATRPVTAENG
jgi:hypothetical protein